MATATPDRMALAPNTPDAQLAHVRQLLASSEASLKAALPSGIPSSYMIRVVLTAVQRTPRLLECHPLSLLGAVFQAAQLGLVPDGFLGQAYLVPYDNKKKRRLEVQFMPGYRGLLTLARRSGEISTIDADVVYAKDSFSFERGTDPVLKHVSYDSDDDPGPLVKVWALAVLKDGGKQVKVMRRREVEKIKARSAAVQARASSPWDTDPEWMWKKTCLKQLCKLLPLSVEAQRAVDLDDRAEVALPQDLVLLADPHEAPTPVEDDASAQLDPALPQRRSDASAATTPALTVARVETANPDTPEHRYFVVVLSNGHRLSTKDPHLATAADALVSKQTPVRLLTAAQLAQDGGVEGTAALVFTPAPDASRAPRLDGVRA